MMNVFKSIFTRLVSKHGIKMKAAVAVQRKLLELMFTLTSKKERYDKVYFNTQQTKQNIQYDLSGFELKN